MSVFHAKYPGLCRLCGERIRQGDLVEWSQGQKARHVRCPLDGYDPSELITVTIIHVDRSSCEIPGDVIRNPSYQEMSGEPEYLIVLAANYKTVEGQYRNRCVCREATLEEVDA